jgi:predicted nucleic-acid-binding protein
MWRMAKNANFLPDTNVLLRYLMRDVEEQYELAAGFFDEVRTGKKSVLILESVLVESIYILTKFYKVPKREAAEVLKGLLQYKGVANKDKAALSAALTLYADKNLDLVDCVLITQAQHRSAEVFSFDKALNKEALKWVPSERH